VIVQKEARHRLCPICGKYQEYDAAGAFVDPAGIDWCQGHPFQSGADLRAFIRQEVHKALHSHTRKTCGMSNDQGFQETPRAAAAFADYCAPGPARVARVQLRAVLQWR
jgi:hypothetical protein